MSSLLSFNSRRGGLVLQARHKRVSPWRRITARREAEPHGAPKDGEEEEEEG